MKSQVLSVCEVNMWEVNAVQIKAMSFLSLISLSLSFFKKEE